MKILYLCRKGYYNTKMSRVRFDGMEAISKVADVIWSGNGWDNYDKTKNVNENIDILYGDQKPDIVVAYKPQDFIDFPAVTIPKCIRYNEMWPVKEWTQEINNFGFNLVIAHHLNDIPKYNHIKDVKFVHIPHSASQTIFKDYEENKVYDVLFTGAMSPKHYPFRGRLLNILRNRLANVVGCKVLGHPGGNLKSVDRKSVV